MLTVSVRLLVFVTWIAIPSLMVTVSASDLFIPGASVTILVTVPAPIVML